MAPNMLLALTMFMFVSVSEGCGDSSDWEGLLWNTFQHSNTSWYIDGEIEPVFDRRRDSLTGTTRNEFFNFLGTNERTLKIFDTGVVCIGICSDGDGFLGSSAIQATEKPFLVVLRTFAPAAISMTFEMKFLLKENDINDDGILSGPNVCYFETVEYRLKPYAGNVSVAELVIVTWRQRNNDSSEELLYQLVLAYTSDNGSYAMMYIHPDVDWSSFMSRVVGHINGNYTDANSPQYARVCGTREEMAIKSNNYCGRPGEVVFDLNNPCTATPYCELAPDPLDRDGNCKDLVYPLDTCYVRGYCNRTSDDEFVFDFVFFKEIASFGDFEVLNGTDELGDPMCTLSPTDNGTYYHVVQVVDQTYIDTCGVSELDGGLYGFTVHNYNGFNAVYEHRTRTFNITCHPDQLPSEAVQEITAGDIVQTTLTLGGGGDVLEMSFGNMANTSDPEYQEFPDGAELIIGQPIYPTIKFQPSPQYELNIYPYGIYVQYCEIGNAADFNDRVMAVIVDRCPVQGVYGFEFLAGFKSCVTAGSSEYCIVGGPFRAARWRDSDSIWLKCVVDFCITTDYEDTYCINSCNGKGANHDESVSQATRKRRQASDTSIVLTAHLMIVDSAPTDTERSLSCANKSLAYTAIAVLLFLLLVATAITGMLFLKLKNRKHK